MNLPSGPGPSQEIFPPPDPVVPPTTVVKREGMNRGAAPYAVLMPREFVRPCLSLSILPLISPPFLYPSSLAASASGKLLKPIFSQN